MFDLFMMGGPLFMGLITVVLIAGLAVAALGWSRIRTGADPGFRSLQYVRSIGLLALVVGVLGQMIGLFSAFEAIERMGEVSPAMLAGGLKVSSITTIYGMLCFVICYVVSLGMAAMAKDS